MKCREREKHKRQLITESFFSRSHDAVIRVYDDAGNTVETHEHTGFQRVVNAGRDKEPPRGEA
jgi:hypothetical protein